MSTPSYNFEAGSNDSGYVDDRKSKGVDRSGGWSRATRLEVSRNFAAFYKACVTSVPPSTAREP